MKLFKKTAPVTRQVKSQYTPSPFMYRSVRSEPAVQRGRKSYLDEETIVGRSIVQRLGSFFGSRLGYVLGTIILFFCLMSVLRLSPNPKLVITSTVSNPFTLRSKATYQAAIKQMLATGLANSNKLTVNTDSIVTKLENKFPELSNVTIAVPIIDETPTVYMQINQPVLNLSESGQHLLIGQDGRVEINAAQAYDIAGLGAQAITSDSNPLPAPTTGSIAIASSDVSFIQTILFELRNGGIRISSLSLPAQARELDVYIVGQPFYVKFNLATGDARQQSGTFLAAWQYLQQHQETPAHYIDVRVDGSAYYQ